jgi:hypothetical protein
MEGGLMPWVRLDDSFFSHPKVVAVGLEAAGLFALSLSYAGAYQTDGHIPEVWAKQQAGPRARRLIDALLAVPPGHTHGLWERNGNGYLIHDFLEHNPSREEYEAETTKRSAAGKHAAQARWSRK